MKKALARYLIHLNPVSMEDVSSMPQRLKTFIFKIDVLSRCWAYEQMDHFSSGELEALQINKLRRILTHAGRSVPYWRALFQRIDFKPDHLKHPDELLRIPILTREQLKRIPAERLVSESVRPVERIPASTSGSTDEPLFFFQDQREVPLRCAAVFLVMHYGKFAKKTPILVIGMVDQLHLRRLGENIPGAVIESRQFRAKVLYPLIRTYRPSVVIASASHLLRLMEHLKSDGFSFKFNGIVYTGESLTEKERGEITGFFGCPINSGYATRECSAIGIPCAHGNHHCLPWLNYVEIVDENGDHCRKGQEGRIVVTYFENKAMPFIRYEIGDHGATMGTICGCGRKSDVIKFHGRIPRYIRLLGGKQFTVRFFDHLFTKYCKEIKKFQVVQQATDAFTIRYVPNPMSELDEQLVALEIKASLLRFIQPNHDVIVGLEKVSAILPNQRGKTPRFVPRG